MRECDVLVKKPSELAYYPIPKVFMRHIGGHEVYGGIFSSQMGDGTFECPEKGQMREMLDRIISDKAILKQIINRINKLKKEGYYDGAYECVKLAAGIKNKK